MKEDIENTISKEIEKCDSLDTILVFASAWDGVGSAFLDMFSKMFKNFVNFVIAPNPVRTNNPTEIYNSVFSLSSIYSKNESLSVLFDNYSAYSIYKLNSKYFENINFSTKDKINQVLSRVISNITSVSRFGSKYTIKDNLMSNVKDDELNPFTIPTLTFEDISKENKLGSIEILTKKSYSLDNSLIQFNWPAYKLITGNLFYRGDIDEFHALSTFKKYYETGPPFEGHLHKDNCEFYITEPNFNDDVERMPEHFLWWTPKGRNYKICREYPYKNLEATNLISSSQVYEYLQLVNSKFDWMYKRRYSFLNFNIWN